MRNKLLASILTVCMLLTMLPAAAFAAETEAESGTEQTATATEQSDPVTEDAGNQTEADGTDAGDAASGQTAENSVAKVGDKYYATLAEAIDVADSKTVTLIANVTENVTIPADTTVTLDLNGKCLTNKNDHTIINYGTLTIQDSVGGGVVDVVTHGKAALCNKGTINEISGGTFTRSKEAGTAKDGNGNSWYTVYNAGTIEKITGGTFENKGTFSSMLINGWNNPGPAVQGYIGTISGGTFTGGVITIKNDDGGHIGKICGDAVITNATQTAIQNTSIIGEISGGTIKGGALAIYNSSWKDEKANEYIGTITIKDGAVIEGGIDNTNWGGDSNTVAQFAKTTIEGGKISGSLKDDNLGSSGCQIVISGGTFSSDPSDYCATGYTATKNESGQWVVSPKEGMEADTSVSGNTASAEVGGTFSGNEDLGQDNVGASNGTLSIDATVTEGDTAAITKTEVSIGNEALTSVSGANSVNSVVLKTNVADLTVDKAAWNAITENANGAKVVLTIEEKAGADGTPLTYTVTAKANGKDVYSTDNAAGSIKIFVKYEGTDVPKVYYDGPDGLEDMKAELKDGILSWTAKHFSDYVVVSGEQKILVKETNGSLKYYGTLTDAITNAGENAVITLLDNLFEKGIFLGAGTKQFTVDFAGHTFTATSLVGSTGTESQAFHLEKGNAVVLKNGAITVAEDQRANAAMLIQNYCNLTLDNMTLDGRGVLQNPNKPLYALSNNCGEIILKSGTTISADEGDFAFDVCWATSYETGARVTMEDGVTINGDVQLGLWGNAAYEGSESVLTVNGGTITGALKLDPNTNEAEAIEALKPNVTINGGSFGSSVDAYLDESDGAKAKVEQKDGMQTYYPSVTEAQKHASSGDTVTDLTVSKDPDKTYYDVTLDYADGVSANLKTPVESGKSYTVPADPSRSGYDFLYWTSGGNRYYAGNTIQVNENITLTANWKEQKDDSSSGSSDNERTYAIVTEDDGNGSVSVSADEASAGTRITVTVKPDAGYELDELTVTDSKNKDLKVTKRSETTYTFHMADSKVTVEASFAKDGTVQQPDTRFDDVAKNAWYYNAVEYVAENGIMSGVSAREFAPNAGFSRAMLAQTLYAMSGKPAVKAESTFADVAANAWYADAVNWAAEKGYVSGVGDGKFAPDASVTREQMALILYRYAGSPDASGMAQKEFTDSSSVSAYAVDAIRWAVHEGLISGMENNTLAPQGTATRAQVAQILMNFHQKLDK